MSNALDYTITTAPTPAEAPAAAPEDGRPENVPEEFWNAETKSVDTEKLLAAWAEKSKPQEAGEGAAEGAAEEEQNAAEKIAEEAGVDVAALEATFAETGEIPADAYEKLAKAGISKETVDEFVQLRQAQAETIRTELLNGVGGEEAVTKMLEWAGANWTEAQANAFNAAASTNDRAQIEMALAGLKASYDKAHPPAPTRPSLVQPGAAKPAGGDVYASMAELMADQRNPRYKNDPAFNAAVKAKLARSPNI